MPLWCSSCSLFLQSVSAVSGYMPEGQKVWLGIVGQASKPKIIFNSSNPILNSLVTCKSFPIPKSTFWYIVKGSHACLTLEKEHKNIPIKFQWWFFVNWSWKEQKNFFWVVMYIFFVLDFRWTAKKFLNELCCIICNSRGLNNYPISDETSLSHKNASKKYP